MRLIRRSSLNVIKVSLASNGRKTVEKLLIWVIALIVVDHEERIHKGGSKYNNFVIILIEVIPFQKKVIGLTRSLLYLTLTNEQ